MDIFAKTREKLDATLTGYQGKKVRTLKAYYKQGNTWYEVGTNKPEKTRGKK